MKKINWMAVCLLLFVLGSSFAMAEGDKSSAPMLSLGVEGGINLSSFNGSTVGDIYDSRLGFVGGAFLSLPLGSGLALQPEVLYEQKGGKINGNDYELDYVEVPVLLDISLLGPISLLLGPAFNATLSSPTGSSINATDVGLILGAQVNLARFLFSGRYEIGLTDLNSDTKIQNGTFTLLVGLSLI